MQKIISILLISILSNLVKAETLTSINKDKLQAIPSLESAMSQSINIVTVKKLNNIPLSQSGINLTLNNQWQLMISSSNKIKISQINVTLDGITVANQVDFDLGKTKLVHYSIATNGLKLQRFNGYTFFGFTNQVLANEYIDYQTLLIKKLQVTIAWNNEQTYNESTTNLLMVYAK